MNMEKLHDIKKSLCETLDTFSGKKDLNSSELDAVQKLTSSIKNIEKIIMFDEAKKYSGDHGGNYSGTYSGNYSGGYDDDYDRSYRGRERDSMGRYSGDDYDYSGRRYRR